MNKILFLVPLVILAINSFAQQMSDAETKALQLANDGKFAEAAISFETIQKNDPKNLNAINILVQLYDKLGNTQKKYEFASKGQALEPDDENWNYTKGEVALKLNHVDEALNLAETFINKYPDSAYMYIIKGLALDAQGKVQLAIGAYSKTIKLHPQNAYALLNRAKDFASISRYQNAVDDFTTLINLGQEIDEIYNRRGLAFIQLGKHDEALQDYTKAININPANQYATANRGWIYFNRQDYSNALINFEKSASIDVTYGDAWFGLASVYNKQKNYPLAIQNAEKAIALNNNMPPYYAIYSSALLASDKNTEGLAAANKILQLDSQNADGYIYKATALSNLEKYDDAIIAITSGIAKYPDNYLMYGVRSFIYKQQGKTSLADADNEKAKALSTKN